MFFEERMKESTYYGKNSTILFLRNANKFYSTTSKNFPGEKKKESFLDITIIMILIFQHAHTLKP